MEQFVLGIFQEQLGKYIVGFRKEMVNANLLNGKGEIRDISINCSAINQQISNVTPFLELESIHISKLGFQVTSWTNLRKAPIVVDIEHITIHITEPLHYLTPRKRRRIRQMTVAEMEQHFQQLEVEAKKNKTNNASSSNNPNKRGAYNLLDRILDNLAIEIKSVYVQFETFGKFKTRRPGPWTPPTLQLILRNLRFVSVDEYGQEGTPEEVWKHNHHQPPMQRGGQERTLLIYKRITMDYDIGIQTVEGTQFSLLKGGLGVPPKPSPGQSALAPASKPKKTNPKQPPCPTAAETVAALAATTGPIEVPVSVPAAADTVAALAATTGSPTNELTKNKASTTSDPPASTTIATIPEKDNDEKKRGDKNGNKNANTPPSRNNNLNSEEKTASRSPDTEPNSLPVDDHNNRIEVHMAMKRRVRDGALLALQVDSTLSKVEVLIPSEVVPYLVHVASGLEYCFCKDRGYEDPLRHPNDRTDHNDSKREFRVRGTTDEMAAAGGSSSATQNSPAVQQQTATATRNTDANTATTPAPAKADKAKGEGATEGNDSTLGDSGIAAKSAEKDSAAKDEAEMPTPATLEDVPGEDENNSLAADVLSVIDETIADDNTDADTLDERSTASQLQQSAAGFTKSFSSFFRKQTGSSSGVTAAESTVSSSLSTYDENNSKRKNRAVIMLPNGLVIHEKISMSISVDRAIIRGLYPPSEKKSSDDDSESNGKERKSYRPEIDDYIQLDSKGTVIEFIWPKTNLEKGGYAQASISYMSIQERFGQRVRTIVAGGIQQDPSSESPIEKPDNPPLERNEKQNFPSFHDRAIREDPLGVRQTFVAQAIGLVTTIDCQTRKAHAAEVPVSSSSPPTTITTNATAQSDPIIFSSKLSNASERTSASNVSNDGVVSFIKVTNDVAVDQFNVVLDCDSWCRVLRFAMNEKGGGFDPRWFSGDWVDTLSTDMLVHPNATLELEDHLQPRAQFFLDENLFPSSDLFNMNAMFSNCELCIPAAIEQNARSCDILTNIDEMSLIVSLDLPRMLPGGRVNAHLEEDEPTSVDKTRDASFPNDVTDVAYELENSEAVNRSKKAKSSFRVKIDAKGLSNRIVPVIPFYVASEPQQLLAPTDLKMLFCFEGEPPETEESNLVKVALFLSLELHQIYTNFDLDLIAGAVSTALHHFQVVKDTFECARKLIPAFKAARDPENNKASVSNSDGLNDFSSAKSANDGPRIKKSFHGRRILVHRQFHRSRETGGLTFVFGMKASEFATTLWRQNVSIHSPLRPATHVADVIERQRLRCPLVKLVHLTANGLNLGTEISFRENDRRIVIKCCLRESRLQVCDLSAELHTRASHHCESNSAQKKDSTPGSTRSADAHEIDSAGSGLDAAGSLAEEEARSNAKDPKCNPKMVEIFNIGKDVAIGAESVGFSGSSPSSFPRENDIVLRCEEHLGPNRSRSIAGDIANGGRVNLHIDELETVFLLILEALMMPTWSRAKLLPRNGTQSFPESSIGALLLSFLPGSGDYFQGFFWLFRKVISLAFPADLRMLLLRLKFGSMLVRVPYPKRQAEVLSDQSFAVLLRRCDLLTWYLSPCGGYHSNLLAVKANEGETWASIVDRDSIGFSHRIFVRQGFHSVRNVADSPSESMLTELVPEFEARLDYLGAKVVTSVENTLSFDDLEKLRDCIHFLRNFSKRAVAIFYHIRSRLLTLKKGQLKGKRVGQPDADDDKAASPVEVACTDVQQSIVSACNYLEIICQSFENYERKHHFLRQEKDAELQRLQRLIFSKEKERVAAVTLASSNVAGWIKMGGTHQSGQRVASTSTFWTYWGILKKEILVLYKGPGKWKPLDFVFLHGAQLRVLEGGRNKRELKRAFGIVENSGKTRFFTVESDHEYLSWTREIQKVTSIYQNAEVKLIDGEFDNLSQRKASSDADDESLGFDSAGPVIDSLNSSQHGSAGISPGRATQIRGKLAGIGSALRMSKHGFAADEKEFVADRDTGTESTAAAVSRESHDTSRSAEVEIGKAGAPTNSIAPGDTPTSEGSIPNRRLQTRGKFAGVGQATNRLGSALSAARQKGREAAEKTRSSIASPGKRDTPNNSSDSALHVISEKEDDTTLKGEESIERSGMLGKAMWTCPKCTFLNTMKGGETDILICEMCECPSETFDVEVSRQEAKEEVGQFRRSKSTDNIGSRDQFDSTDSDKLYRRSQSDMGHVDEDDFSVVSDLAMDDSERPGNRRGVRNRLGVALGGIRRPSQNRQAPALEGESRGWLGRLGGSNPSSQDIDGFQKPQVPVKLKNVKVDAGADFESMIGPPISDIPLRKLHGHWFALVRTASTSAPLSNEGPSTERGTLSDAAPDEGVSEEANKLGNESSQALTEAGYAESIADQSLPPSIGGDSARARSRQHSRMIAGGATSQDKYFCIQIFHRAPGENTKQPKKQVCKWLSEIASFHAVLSEFIVEILLHPIFQETSLQRTPSGEMSEGLKNVLGISPVDSIRISGNVLAGLLDANSNENEVPPAFYAEAVMEFLNSSLVCPLPSGALFALTDFLNIQDAPTIEISSTDSESLEEEKDSAKHVSEECNLSPTTDSPTNCEDMSNQILALSSICTSELLQAERNGNLATELANAMSRTNTNNNISPALYEPLLPTHVTEHLQEAMHSALMKVMAERDEAHAQLVSASVLHAHALEQQKKKAERLEGQLEVAQRKALKLASASQVFGIDRLRRTEHEKQEEEKLRKTEMEMQRNTDAEMVALCQQLSSEISSKTKAALEVVRLKESRAIERQHEIEEKEALKNELIRMRELLAKEQSKTEEALREAEKWKQSYEKVAEEQKRRNGSEADEYNT